MPVQMPFGLYSPEMLAQMAQGAFKPPQPMSMGGGQQQQRPQQPGFNVSQGIAALGAGLDGWKPGGAIRDESGAVGPGGLAGAVTGINALQPGANGVWQPPPMPTNIGSGQGGNGGGGLDMSAFFNGSWLQKLGLGGGPEFFTGASLDGLGMPDIFGGTGGGSSGFGGG